MLEELEEKIDMLAGLLGGHFEVEKGYYGESDTVYFVIGRGYKEDKDRVCLSRYNLDEYAIKLVKKEEEKA